MSKSYDGEIDRFIYEVCFSHIWEKVNELLSIRPNILDLSFSHIKYPDYALIEDMILEFTRNIRIKNDSLLFDAILSCTIELTENDEYRGQKNCEISQWLHLSCEAIITNKLNHLIIHNIEPYKSGKRNMVQSGVAASKNIVPIIRKDDLDDEAEAFLNEYYSEAICNVIPVPIEKIITEIMKLEIVHGRCLGEELDVLGEICFSKGKVDVYDLFKCKRSSLEVERGTIIIDADTLMLRNQGCVNNTLAHEAFHWHRHRLYAAIKAILNNEKIVACRCPRIVAYPQDQEDWTDTDRMEWQANKIAPRILMPRQNFTKKVNELYQSYDYNDAENKIETLKNIINELSEFYGVSRQSAKIRLIDIGHAEASYVYNYEDYLDAAHFQISPEDAFFEYVNNPQFHETIDSGLFRYVEEHYVIDSDIYCTKNPDGTYSLTDNAKTNPYECMLQFTSRRVAVNKHEPFFNGVLYHSANGYANISHYDSGRNKSVEEAAAEDLKRRKDEFKKQFEFHKSMTKTFAERTLEIMSAKHVGKITFMDLTGLNEMSYSRLINHPEITPDLRTVVSVCSGLGLDLSMTKELMDLAGYTFNNSLEHQAYSFVITNLYDKDLDEKNAFLESLNVKPLGSIQRV